MILSGDEMSSTSSTLISPPSNSRNANPRTEPRLSRSNSGTNRSLITTATATTSSTTSKSRGRSSSTSRRKKKLPDEDTEDVSGKLLLDLTMAKKARFDKEGTTQAVQKTIVARKSSARRILRTKQAKTMMAYVEQKTKQLVSEFEHLKATLDLLGRLKKIPDEDAIDFIFCLIDKDGGGTVSASELSTALRHRGSRELAFSFDIDRAVDLIAKFDTSGDGELDAKEFGQCIQAMLTELNIDIRGLGEFLILQSINEDPNEVAHAELKAKRDHMTTSEASEHSEHQNSVASRHRIGTKSTFGTSSHSRQRSSSAGRRKEKSNGEGKSLLLSEHSGKIQGVLRPSSTHSRPRTNSIGRRKEIIDGEGKNSTLLAPSSTVQAFFREVKRVDTIPIPIEQKKESPDARDSMQMDIMDIGMFVKDKTVQDLFKMLDQDDTKLLKFSYVAPRLYLMATKMDQSVKKTMHLLLMMEKTDRRTLNYDQFARLVFALVITAKTNLNHLCENLTNHLIMESIADSVLNELVPSRSSYKETRIMEKNQTSTSQLSQTEEEQSTQALPFWSWLQSTVSGQSQPTATSTTTATATAKRDRDGKRGSLLRTNSAESGMHVTRRQAPARQRSTDGTRLQPAESTTNNTIPEPVVSPLLYARLQLLFDLWDVNGDGDISLVELSVGMKRFHEAAGLTGDIQANASSLLRFDDDGNQVLDRHEFVRALLSYAHEFNLSVHDMIDLMSLTMSLHGPNSSALFKAYQQTLAVQ